MALKALCILGCLLLVLRPVMGQDENELREFRNFFEVAPSTPLEEALRNSRQRLEQAQEIGDPVEEARALRHLGLVYLTRLPDYAKAMDAFIRALVLEDSMQLETRKILTYVAIADVFRTVGDYYKCSEFLQHAMATAPDRQHINTVTLIRIRLGQVQALSGREDEALATYELALKHRREVDPRLEAEATFRIGHLHVSQSRHTEALSHYKRALAIVRRLGNRRLEAQYLTDIGNLYALMENEPRSLANHEVALELREALGDPSDLAQSHNNLGLWYHRQQQPQKALTHATAALDKAREAGDQEQIFRSYDLLSQVYQYLGDYRNALEYRDLSLAMYEFMQHEKEERQLLETQNRYVVEQKEAEIDRLETLRRAREREIAEQKRFRNTLFLVVLLVLVIAGLLLILALVKHRANRALRASQRAIEEQNTQLQQLNNTKDKFFSIIGHDLKGPLNSLTSFSHLLINHTDHMSKEEIRMLASDLDKSVKNLFALLENLLQWARTQTGNISFTPERFSLDALLTENHDLLARQAHNKNITLRVDARQPVEVTLHRASIDTVVRNLLANAIKFTPEGGEVRVGVQLHESALVLYVADNGVGMSQQVVDKLFRIENKMSTAGTAGEKGTGLGLILCADFVARNGGRLSVKSEVGKGSVFSCAFPRSVVVGEPAVKSRFTTA